MLGFVAGTALIMLLWKAGGGEVAFDDPNDPNTLKLKWEFTKFTNQLANQEVYVRSDM